MQLFIYLLSDGIVALGLAVSGILTVAGIGGGVIGSNGGCVNVAVANVCGGTGRESGAWTACDSKLRV